MIVLNWQKILKTDFVDQTSSCNTSSNVELIISGDRAYNQVAIILPVSGLKQASS